ncbi:DUF1731 domain-containing protein [Amycolatopsis sp. NPDC058278]|uniref:DUF1731 domain-containing protein n=1 Tax=Amycolatopsis sp. NPDC058278 TaxID=3346417 RepID=UPI0036DDD0D6
MGAGSGQGGRVRGPRGADAHRRRPRCFGWHGEIASWSGAYNGTAPEPVTQREFSKALGRALHRPAVLPVPGFALRVALGELADMVTTGRRAVPHRALDGGYRHAHPRLAEALTSASS